LTDVGRRRVVNEDSFFMDDELGLYIVADGMGGHAAGEIASKEAVDTVHGMVKRGFDCVDKLLKGDESPENFRSVMRLVESAAQAATYMVFAIAQNEPEQHGMGTTLSVLLLTEKYGFTAQVGDSRVYLVRDGSSTQLTEDHTLVAWQLKQGIITEDEAAVSPHKNVITRAVGSREYVQVDTHMFEIQSGDNFLICSDGLHGYLKDEEIPSVIDLGPSTAVRKFIELANERGGRDNITAVIVELT
jgi:protein phosphatase